MEKLLYLLIFLAAMPSMMCMMMGMMNRVQAWAVYRRKR